MKNLKKLLSLVLALALIMSLAVPALAAGEDITLTVSNTAPVVGDTVTVTVDLNTSLSIGNYGLRVWYDPDAFEFNKNSSSLGDNMNAFMIKSIDIPLESNYADEANFTEYGMKPVNITATSFGSNVAMATGTMATLSFTAKEASSDAKFEVQTRTLATYDSNTEYKDTVTVSAPTKTTVTATRSYNIEISDEISNGTVVADPTTAAEGDKVTLTVTPDEGYILENLTYTYTPAGEGAAEVTSENIKDTKSFTMPAANVTVNATFRAITAGYNVAMGADLTGEKAVTANQPITIPITVGHKAAENQTAETNFKSYELAINYGVGNLKLTNETSTDSDYSVDNDETAGIAVIRRFGDLINLGDGAINLNFVANKVGTHTVTITDAKVGNSSSAKNDDIPDAEILDASIQIEVGGYNVNLDTTVFEGDQTVDPAKDYEFAAKDKNYDYTSVIAYYTDAEGNKHNVTVTDNGDGTYTIAANQIEGDVTIEYTREGKLFDISLGEDMKHNSGTEDVTVEGNTVQKIRYMTDYTAVLEKKDGFTYQVTATKNDEPFNDFTYDETTGIVTVEGKFITGDIVFNSGKESEQPTAYTVTFIGNCKNHASGNASVAPGVDYSFTLNRAPGYTYTISYAVGQVTEETVFTPMDMTGDPTSFTIAKERITGNLTIKIEGTSDLQVTVNEYVAMSNDQVAYLVTATQTLAEDKTLGYEDGVDEQNNQKYSSMYYRDYTEEVTDEAGQTTSKTVRKYFWLDIQQKPADGEEAAFNAEVAKAKISVLEATSTELTETFNVNQSTSTDINDAQLVYDMYNALYGDFNTVSIMKYLLADLSGDNKLSVQDAAAIVRHIINPDTNQAG